MVCSFALLFAAVAWITPTMADEPELLPQKLLDAGWIRLFDGQTLYGWQRTGAAEWNVADGTVSTKGDKPGWLMTTTEWCDYELHVEFKAPASTNSGIFLRTVLDPKDVTKDCVELNIAPRDNPFPTASLVGRRRLSTKPQRSDAGDPAKRGTGRADGPKVEIDAWDGQWHAFDVQIEGNSARISLDGRPLDVVLLSTLADGTPGTVRHCGHIGLQANQGEVAFRNIRLRPLGLKPLLNGKDLTGWTVDGTGKSEFTVTDAGELHLSNGPGQIATDESFQDFVLQLECKVNGDGLNSGVFFRTLPTGRWQGYESQINNRYHDGDRTRPTDYGTGGIYRRQPARRVVADDHQWFTNTIVAEGPHMAVWVNGYQVSDWIDKRSAAKNPPQRTTAWAWSDRDPGARSHDRFSVSRRADRETAAVTGGRIATCPSG